MVVTILITNVAKLRSVAKLADSFLHKKESVLSHSMLMASNSS